MSHTFSRLYATLQIRWQEYAAEACRGPVTPEVYRELEDSRRELDIWLNNQPEGMRLLYEEIQEFLDQIDAGDFGAEDLDPEDLDPTPRGMVYVDGVYQYPDEPWTDDYDDDDYPGDTCPF